MKENTKKWLIVAIWGTASVLTGLVALRTDHPIAWVWAGVCYLRFYYLSWTTPLPGFEEFSMGPRTIWVQCTLTLLIIAFAIPFRWAFIPAILSLGMLIYEIFKSKKEVS